MNGKVSENTVERNVVISGNRFLLEGKLNLPAGANALVVFAHGSGSSRFSPRNNFVARILNNHRIATLLLDLLSEKEAEDRSRVFDIELLAERLVHVKAWLKTLPETNALPLGYFGASTGAGAALVAAARDPENLFAIVSRGGRPDLASRYLREVTIPTLLIVGGKDDMVIDLNCQALEELRCTKRLEIVPGATHLFEEPGTLERVADLAANWFMHHSRHAQLRSA